MSTHPAHYALSLLAALGLCLLAPACGGAGTGHGAGGHGAVDMATLRVANSETTLGGGYHDQWLTGYVLDGTRRTLPIPVPPGAAFDLTVEAGVTHYVNGLYGGVYPTWEAPVAPYVLDPGELFIVTCWPY